MKQGTAGLQIRYKDNRDPQDAERMSMKGRENVEVGVERKIEICHCLATRFRAGACAIGSGGSHELRHLPTSFLSVCCSYAAPRMF